MPMMPTSSFLKQRHNQQGPSASKIGEPAPRVLRLRQDIFDMDHPLGSREVAEGGFRMGADDGFAPPQLGVGRRRTMERNMPESAIFVERHGAEVRLAYARRVLQHRVEHGLQFAGRA